MSNPIASEKESTITINVYQHDWIPGFAAFHEDGAIQEGAPAHVVLNLGSLMCAIAAGDLPKEDLPYIIAESLMHETVHALESWAGVEFSEERVEELLMKYHAKYGEGRAHWVHDSQLTDEQKTEQKSASAIAGYSNPSEAPAKSEKCSKCGSEYRPQNDSHYCFSCDEYTEPMASDPSGKGAEQSALDAALLLHDKVGETTGYSSRNVIPILAAALEQYAASLRQQLSEHEKFAREVATDLGAGSVAETSPISELRGLIFNLLHARKIDHDDLEGKVSQLEANPKMADCSICGAAIWAREERISEIDGEWFHPICKVKARLSAVSEVVRTGKLFDAVFWDGKAGLAEARELRAALTSYEKAQQKEGQ